MGHFINSIFIFNYNIDVNCIMILKFYLLIAFLITLAKFIFNNKKILFKLI